jgi:hypothetical protein
VEINLEIPIEVITGPRNISEGESFIKIHRELKRHVCFKTEYHILDSGYDYGYVYQYIRENESKPIIDYNKAKNDPPTPPLLGGGYQFRNTGGE